jgi:hypothetical protein
MNLAHESLVEQGEMSVCSMSVGYPLFYNYFLGDSRFSAVIPECERLDDFGRKAT